MSPVHPAPLQLLDLAATVRPDWDRRELEGAIANARTSGGWSWPKVLTETARLMADPDASPRDLAVAARDPLERSRPGADTYARGLAAVREAMAAKGSGS